MNQQIERQKKLDMLLVFLIAFIPRLILVFLYASPLRTPMDEMSTISTAAFFGGKDWTALTTYAKFYYGGGFTILFAPLFRLTNNPYVLYWTMLSVCALLQSISAPIVYTILRNYMKVDKRIYVIISSVACSYFVVVRSMEVYNEHIIIGCIWIIAWLLCRVIYNQDNYKRKALDSVILMFVMSYVLTTHTRTKVMWYAFVIIVILYRWVYKKWIVAMIPTILSGGIGYYTAQRFIEMIKTRVWDWQEGEFLRNASVKMEISLADFKNPISWEAIANTILGQSNTLLILSGGLLAVMLLMLVKLYWDTVVERVRKKKPEPELELQQEQELDSVDKQVIPYIIVVSAMFMMCMVAVIAAQSLTWLHRVVTALTQSTYGSTAYGYKAITYMRYCGPFAAPLFMAGLAYIYHKKEDLRRYILPSIALTGVLQLVWVTYLLPHICNNRTASEVFVAFTGFQITVDGAISVKTYLMGSVILVVLFVIAMICFYKKKIVVPVLLTTLLLGYEYVYGAIYWDGAYADQYTKASEEVTDLIMELEQNDEYSDILPQEIYVSDRSGSVQKMMYRIQFMLNDKTIIPGAPDETAEDGIVFSKTENSRTQKSRGYVKAQLDDTLFLYVKGDTYIQMFEDAGVEFVVE